MKHKFLFAMAALLVSVSALADNTWFEESRNFSAYSLGQGNVHVKVLVFAAGSFQNHWATDASYIQAKVDGNTYNVLNYKGDNSKNTDNDYRGWASVKALDGTIVITNPAEGSKITLQQNSEWEGYLSRTGQSDRPAYLEFDWYPSATFTGKTYNINAHIVDTRKTGKTWTHDWNLGSYEVNSLQSPMLYNAVFSNVNGNGHRAFGQLMVPYVVYQTTREYTPVLNGKKGTTVTSTDRSGSIMVMSADSVQQSFYAIFSVMRDGGTTYSEVQSSKIYIPAFHRIHDFKVSDYTRPDGTTDARYAQLKWTLKYPDDEDVITTDMFQVQRSYNRDFTSSETLTLISLEKGVSTYEYIDSVDAAFANTVDASLPVYYRVQRASTINWGGTGHEWVANDSIQKHAKLLTLDDTGCKFAKASDFAETHNVNVTLRTKKEDGENFWNSAAQLTLRRVTIANGQNDTTTRLVSAGEFVRQSDGSYLCTVSVKAEVSCAKYIYEIQMDDSNCLLKNGDKSWHVITGDDLYYTEAASIASFNASKGYYPDYVFLQWDQTSGAIDNYNIARRDLSNADGDWDDLATVTGENYYQDKSGVAGHHYQYRIVCSYNCNGDTFLDTAMAYGWLSNVGTIAGRITYPNGTGNANVVVEAVGKGGTIQRGFLYRQATSDNDYITAEPVEWSGSRTYQALVKAPDPKGNYLNSPLFSSYRHNAASTENGVALMISDSRLVFKYGTITLKDTTDLPDNQWVSVAVVCDAAKDSIALYRNGHRVAVAKMAGTQIVASANIYFLSGTVLAGLDEFRMWNRALTDKEVENTAHTYLSGKEDGLHIYYSFDNAAKLPQASDSVYHVPNQALLTRNDTHRNDLTAKEILATGAPDATTLNYKSISGESGNYAIGGIPFAGGATYNVTPTSEHGVFTYNGTSASSAAISLDERRPEATDIDFVNTAAVRFSGRVLYDLSTIPVKGAHFKVDGVLATDASGALVETNASGNFDFEVPKAPITVQVVMDGHTFYNNGFFEVDDKTTFTPTNNMDGLRMWDETKVRLVGRIAGGNVQGLKPLGASLSKNNLGDSILMVLELEGDNVAQIVYDRNNKTREQIDTVVPHAVAANSTAVSYQRKRILVHPDNKTGEFFVDLFPVKYKLTQLTAQGYSTLTNGSSGIPVIDLTKKLERKTLYVDTIPVAYNDTFRYIYHSPVTITLKQVQYGMTLGYLGTEKVILTRFDTIQTSVKLATKNAAGDYDYLFGKPIFTEGDYVMRISAHEDYYYNANKSLGTHEQVNLHGGNVRVYNGMHSESEVITGTLDENGEMQTVLRADYPTHTRLGDDATRSIQVSVEYQGEYIQSDPLDVYVFADRTDGTNSIGKTYAGITLYDILRDPPGANSFATLAEGASYTVEDNYSLAVQAGVNLNFEWGANYKGVAGAIVGATAFTGEVISTSSSNGFTIPLVFDGNWKWSYSDTHTTTDQISTSDNAYHVGEGADVYIGKTNNIYHTIGHGMVVIDSLYYAAMAQQINDGTMKLVAQAYGSDGKPYYLVVAQKVFISFGRAAEFVYTQEHILTSILPTLEAERNKLLQCVDKATAQANADLTKSRVYYSKVPAGDKNFGLKGYYGYVDPTGGTGTTLSDSVDAYNRAMLDWYNLIYINEHEKVVAFSNPSNLFKTYSVSGGAPKTHTETVSYASTDAGSYGMDMNNILDLTLNFGSKLPATVLTLMQTQIQQNDDGTTQQNVTVEAPGTKFNFSLKPVVNFDFDVVPGTANSHSRTYSFTLSPDEFGYMDVDVYQLKDTINSYNADAKKDSERNFKSEMAYNSFVYRTLSGASRCPHEEADSTLIYAPGTPLNFGTLAIEKPRITANRREVSDVPADQTAIFNLKLSNDQASEIGLAASTMPFDISVPAESNPYGLKLSIDGMPITAEARTIRLPHGTTVNKVLEVSRGQGYDFEDVKIRLASQCNILEYDEVTISVHFVPAATPLSISVPHDKWVLNTQSMSDSAGYYLPVEIDGFDIHSDGFDHIELQYKQLNQSDVDWVNLCSFYASDSLYQLASGTKAMINYGKIDNVRFYGERDPMEQDYDLRAVSFARYGNGFVTKSSNVMHGTKDTRCPEVFGLPTPADGILGVSDVLSLRFSEPIAGNYLDEDANFEVVGGTNNLDIAQSTSLYFTGESNCFAESQISRNMSHRPLTIEALIKPSEAAGRTSDMTIFALNSDKKPIIFSLTKENELRLQVDTFVTTSKAAELMQAFTRCAVTLDTTGAVRFYVGTADLTQENQPKLTNYVGKGTLLVGNNPTHTAPFNGNMLELRLWATAQTQDELALTLNKRLTGYERELMDYYPMNEAKGTSCKDLSNGATLKLNGTSWTHPEGLSFKFDGTQGVRLNQDVLSRSGIQDLTLMFWFKSDEHTPDTAALFTTGGGYSAEPDASSKVFIGLDHGNVVLRHRGHTYTATGSYADKTWHHFAFAVNRVSNVASLYIDGSLASTFAADSLLGISSTEMWLGACHWRMPNAQGGYSDQPTYNFSGHIDHLMLYEQALPYSTIKNFNNVAPSGNEMGLIAYLPIGVRKESSFGVWEVRYSPYNARVFYDNDGNVVDKKQAIVLTPDSVAAKMVDKSETAPMRESMSRTNFKFSWANNSDELLINLKMLDKEINKQNIFITVRDVEDLHGNKMLNPISWTVYVDRNQLRWSDSTVKKTIEKGDSEKFEVKINNTGGATRQYKITSLPSWLSAVPSSGTLEPQGSQTIEFTIAEGLNVGEYTEYIYLQDDQDLYERLIVNLEVETSCPWEEKTDDLPLSMNLVGQVLINEKGKTIYDTDENDIVAAFIDNRCVGKANITYDDKQTINHVYMTIHGNENMDGDRVQMRLWRASTGTIYSLESNTPITFDHTRCYGCLGDSVVILTTSDRKVQQLTLNSGWNWVSFYLKPTYANDINKMLDAQTDWTDNDIVKSPGSRVFSQYWKPEGSNGAWVGTLKTFDYRNIYMFYANNYVMAEIEGTPLSTKEERTLSLAHGWNVLPYLQTTNLSLTEALADYAEKATVGDIVKSKDKFAVFSSNKKWEGNLTYMQPGMGYMLNRRDTSKCHFTYFEDNSSPSTAAAEKLTRAVSVDNDEPQLFVNRASSNMSVIAVVDAPAELRSMDNVTLAAYVGDALAGRVAPYETDSVPLFFLTVGAEQSGVVRFALEQNGDVVAYSAPMFSYAANGVAGAIDNPLVISFTRVALEAYPSPFTDHVQIALTTPDAEGTADIRIYDVTGRMLTHTTAAVDGHLLLYRWDEAATVPAGVYTATVRYRNENYNVKLIKQ